MSNNTLLESDKLPVDVINIASAKEKGSGRPPFWKMVFWWTRKPLASARAIILASLLPGDYDPGRFLRVVYPSYEGSGRFSKTPHFLNPNVKLLDREIIEKIRNTSLLDPFAGFGSIPLEAVRLGVGRVVACELLPVAVVFLRAVLEIPKWVVDEKLDRELLKDIEKWSNWIVDELRNDPDIKELYDEDTAVYIGTWEIKCPYCGKYTPLVGNWWLARVKNKKGFKALAWMKPVKTPDGVEIAIEQITDPAELLTARSITKGRRTIGVKTIRGEYRVGDEKLSGEPNIDARRQRAVCLNCYAELKGTRDKWIVKEALREWNSNLEKYLDGEIMLDQLRQTHAKPIILVKVKKRNKTLHFEPAVEADNEKLWKALEKLKTMWKDPDIPTEEIPDYENRAIWTQPYGLNKHYRLFNPRQLLTLVKLVKLIREAGKKIEEEKQIQKWDKQKARKYAEAATTYLTIALCKHSDWNSIVSGWQLSYLIAAHSLAMRGISMVWNWGEYSPLSIYRGTISAMLESMAKAIKYIVNATSNSYSCVKVILDDAITLGRLWNEKFDIIVSDPPYRDDVPYAELSDFYYVWLKRASSDSNGVSLTPRFHADVFFAGDVEIRTQWEWFSPREISLSTGRCMYFGEGGSEDECEKKYREKLAESFRAMASRLKDNGLIITYFAQSSPDAWIALIEAGLSSGFYPSIAFPVITESEGSAVSRGKSAITASIVVAWRETTSGEPVDIASSYDALVDEASRELERIQNALLRAAGNVVSELYGVTIYVMSYARILSLLTKNGRPVKNGKPLSTEEIVRYASEILARAYAKASGAELTSSDSIFYYMIKKIFPRSSKGRRIASSSDLLLLGYGLSGQSKVSVLKQMTIRGILREYRREEETEVASRKKYILIEPRRSNDELELAEVLKLHGVNPSNPQSFRSPVHALHALMLYSLKPRDVFTSYYNNLRLLNPILVSEAIELAKALLTIENDPETELARRVLEYVGYTGLKLKRGDLLDYFKR